MAGEGSISEAQWGYVTQHIIDIPKDTAPILWPECCIYKVPEILRKGNPEAYTPRLISIGPIHHGKPELKQMEQEKQRYFHFFSERLPAGPPPLPRFHSLKSFKDFLGTKEEEIRRCYSEKYPDTDDFKFLNVILLDSVFIMEWFLRNSIRSDDYLLKKAWLRDGVQKDLLLLENQVPIFVLKNLYDNVVLNFIKLPEDYNFLDLARHYFARYDPQKSFEGNKLKEYWENSLHFTDLIRYFYIPQYLSADEGSYVVLKTATKLREAGVSFEPVFKKCLLDITFKKKPFLSRFLCLGCFPCSNCVKARFQIPQLKVDDSMECVLRNLIALEQCHYPFDRQICSYVALLEDLIHSNEDVELLVEKGVITHMLSSDQEMVTMINSLCKHVVISSSSYQQITKELNNHYDSNWNRYMGEIRNVYFRDLWRISTTTIGIAVFLFSVIGFLHTVGVKF